MAVVVAASTELGSVTLQTVAVVVILAFVKTVENEKAAEVEAQVECCLSKAVKLRLVLS